MALVRDVLPVVVIIPPVLVVLNNVLLTHYLQRGPTGKHALGEILYYINVKKLPNGDLTLAAFFLGVVFVALCIAIGVTTYDEPPIFPNADPIYLVSPAAGNVAMVNYWLAMLPTAKTSLWLKATGVPFERAVKFHKVLMFAGFCSTLVHFFTSGLYNAVGKPPPGRGFIVFGFIALIIMFALIVASSDPVRLRYYNFFKTFHYMSFLFIIFAVLHHVPNLYGFIPGLVFHFADYLVKVNVANAATVAISAVTFRSTSGSKDADVTALEMKCPSDVNIRQGIPLGGYFFLSVSGLSTPFVEWHPFSVSGTDPDKGTVTFHIQALGAGSFSRKLFELVHKETPASIERAERGDSGQFVSKVALYGPFGGLSLDLARYETVLLFCGGLGITPMLHVLEQLVIHNPNRYAFVKRVQLVWSMRDLGLLALFAERLTAASKAASSRNVSVQYDIHYTGKLSQDQPSTSRNLDSVGPISTDESALSSRLLKSEDTAVVNSTAPSGFAHVQGRPNVKAVVDTACRVHCRHSTTIATMCLLVCGTAGLSDQAYQSATTFGVAFHKETFGY